MRRILLLASALLFCLGLPALGAEPWPGVPYKEVRAYAWPADDDPVMEVVSSAGRPRPGALNPKGTRLSKAQVQQLLAAQRRRANGIRTLTACYNPHNAFVFLDARGRTVAFLEICFDCHNFRSLPVDEQADPDLPALAAIFAELKLPFGEQKSLDELRKLDRAFRSMD